MNNSTSVKDQGEKVQKNNKENGKVSFLNQLIKNKEIKEKKRTSKKNVFDQKDLTEKEEKSPQTKNRIKRSYTLNKEIVKFTLGFVPKLKPLKIKLVPSKFQLNDKKNKEKSNSCPCSDYYDSDEEEDFTVKLEIDKRCIKDTRKDLVKIKDNTIPHIMTKQILNNGDIPIENAKIANIYDELNNDDIFPDIEIQKVGDLTPSIDFFDKNEESGKNRNFSFSCFSEKSNIIQNRKKRNNSISIIDALRMKNQNNNNK